MKKLLKTDFYLLIKNFLFKLLIVLGIVFSAFTIMQGLMFSKVGDGKETVGGGPNGQTPPGGMMFDTTGKSIFTSSFSLSIGFAMIIAVVLALLVAQQFVNGSVRNKIIAGNKKSTVYYSLIAVHVLTGVALLGLYGILRLVFGSITLGYDADVTFNASELLYCLQVTGLSLLVYVAVFAFSVFLATVVRASGTSILCVIGFILFLSLTANIDMLISDWTFLKTLCDFNPTNMLSNILESELSWQQWLIIVGGSIGLSSAVTFGGAVLFSKRDLK